MITLPKPNSFNLSLGVGAWVSQKTRIGNRSLILSLMHQMGGWANASKAVALWPFSSRAAHAKKSVDRKRILIMMSNTGGGHRASAEAIKAAFKEKYGDEYEVIVEDIWTNHTPSPFNKLPDSYSFLVRHSFLWWLSYMTMNPR